MALALEHPWMPHPPRLARWTGATLPKLLALVTPRSGDLRARKDELLTLRTYFEMSAQADEHAIAWWATVEEAMREAVTELDKPNADKARIRSLIQGVLETAEPSKARLERAAALKRSCGGMLKTWRERLSQMGKRGRK
jgi:hypothetical protein